MVNKSRIAALLCLSFFTASNPVLADDLSQDGIQVGINYEHAKGVMLTSGWSVIEDKDEYSNNPYEAYPEISCGAGRDSICSVGFAKDERFIALTIESRNGTLVISGEY